MELHCLKHNKSKVIKNQELDAAIPIKDLEHPHSKQNNHDANIWWKSNQNDENEDFLMQDEARLEERIWKLQGFRARS